LAAELVEWHAVIAELEAQLRRRDRVMVALQEATQQQAEKPDLAPGVLARRAATVGRRLDGLNSYAPPLHLPEQQIPKQASWPAARTREAEGWR